MFLIECPFCGLRDESEFRCGGEAHIARPAAPATLTDREWAEYLYYRDNAIGPDFERWQHLHGCRQWFNLARDTVTHEIKAIYPMGAPKPEVEP